MPPLEAVTRYTWDAELTDDRGKRGRPGRSWFETGLLIPGGVDGPLDPAGPAGRPPGSIRRRTGDPDAERPCWPPVPVPPGIPGSASPPVWARAYVTAQGVYQLRVNGERVGRDELIPGWTDYHYRLSTRCMT